MNSSQAAALLKAREKWIRFFNHLFLESDEMWNLYSITHRLIIAYNFKSTAVTGYTLEELKQTPIERIYPQTELLKLGGIFENLKTKFVTDDDLKFYAKNGDLTSSLH